MKNIFMGVAMLVMVASCHQAIIPIETPFVNPAYINESGQEILAGHAAYQTLEQPLAKSWFTPSYNNYVYDQTVVTELKPLLKGKSIEIFLGSWCGDSKREVPRMLKVLENAGMDTGQISLIFVDNAIKQYKQSPQHEEKGKLVHHVPTFIIYDGKKEKGRINETPVGSLEKDLLAILKNENYQPKYKGISFWTKEVKQRKQTIQEEELNRLALQIKPLFLHAGEFNAYGYTLLASKDFTEALNVLKLNTLLYPDEPNTFDSLGEAFEIIGNKPAAINAYEKVLVMNPTDANAKMKIASLKQ